MSLKLTSTKWQFNPKLLFFSFLKCLHKTFKSAPLCVWEGGLPFILLQVLHMAVKDTKSYKSKDEKTTFLISPEKEFWSVRQWCFKVDATSEKNVFLSFFCGFVILVYNDTLQIKFNNCKKNVFQTKIVLDCT